MSRWVGLILGIVVGLSLVINAVHLWRFINAGPRFTAFDGQALCERVQAHERFHGLPLQSCDFGKGD